MRTTHHRPQAATSGALARAALRPRSRDDSSVAGTMLSSAHDSRNSTQSVSGQVDAVPLSMQSDLSRVPTNSAHRTPEPVPNRPMLHRTSQEAPKSISSRASALDAARHQWAQRRPASSFAVPSEIVTGLSPDCRAGAAAVRFHNDHFAHQVATAFGLEAFTVGKDVYFGKDSWHPTTAHGQAIIEHEMEHVAKGEGCHGTVEGWSSNGHRTITLRALVGDERFSASAQTLLAETSLIPDFNRPEILQDMVSFWSGEKLWRAPLGFVGGAILGGLTPPDHGSQIGSVRVSGILPQAVLGTGLIRTIPKDETIRRPDLDRNGKPYNEPAAPRSELTTSRVPQEVANHGEDLPERNQARMDGYVHKGIALADEGKLYEGLIQLGYALHIAQDRGSHGDGYTLPYVQGKPHSKIDSTTDNPEGVDVAFSYTHHCLDRFFNGLTPLRRRQLAEFVGSISPPLLETMLPRPESGGAPNASGGSPDDRTRVHFPDINVFTVQF